MKKYFYTREEQVVPLEGLYSGQSLFLIVSGPSLSTLDLSRLSRPGVMTMGVNNSPKVFRPDLWVSVDDPANFMLSIWRDPKIKKFVMHGKRNKILWDNTAWKESTYPVYSCPNVIYYKDNEYFKKTDEFLDEETLNWGNHTDRCECGVMRKAGPDGKKERVCSVCGGTLFGVRSVMLAAIKLAYVLGFRKVFILGADFDMSETKTYAWKQDRTRGSINNNMSTYARLNKRFSELRPIFESRNFFVFNATPGSNLNSFIKVSFDEAIKMATTGFPKYENERTYGMYERKAVDKDIKQGPEKITSLEKSLADIPVTDVRKRDRLERRLKKERDKYITAIQTKEKFQTWTE